MKQFLLIIVLILSCSSCATTNSHETKYALENGILVEDTPDRYSAYCRIAGTDSFVKTDGVLRSSLKAGACHLAHWLSQNLSREDIRRADKNFNNIIEPEERAELYELIELIERRWKERR